MAYSGASGYVDREIAPLFSARPDLGPAADTDRLIRLFTAFVDADCTRQAS